MQMSFNAIKVEVYPPPTMPEKVVTLFDPKCISVWSPYYYSMYSLDQCDICSSKGVFTHESIPNLFLIRKSNAK